MKNSIIIIVGLWWALSIAISVLNSFILILYAQDELLNELEELEQEGLDEDLLQIVAPTSLPNVPVTDLPAAPGKFWVTWIE